DKIRRGVDGDALCDRTSADHAKRLQRNGIDDRQILASTVRRVTMMVMFVESDLISTETNVHHTKALADQGVDNVELAIVARPARHVEALLIGIKSNPGWDRDVAPLESCRDLT